MNYFTAGLYGDLARYKKIKSLLKPTDHLWVLGDAIDGNTEKPWECLSILDDIFQSDNITLILGDHEYYHALYLIECGALSKEEPDEDFVEELATQIDDMDISGKALRLHIDNYLTSEERASYAQILLSCAVTDMVKIGDYVLYLCHGAPAKLERNVSNSENSVLVWQEKVVSDELNLSETYFNEIKSDPNFRKFNEKLGPLPPPIIVTGGTPIEVFTDDGENLTDGILFKNKKFALNEGIIADDGKKGPFSVLAMDAAGFFIKKIRV